MKKRSSSIKHHDNRETDIFYSDEEKVSRFLYCEKTVVKVETFTLFVGYLE